MAAMGYGGYAPGMQHGLEALTDLERALRALPLDKADDTLEIIEKLTRNVVRNPREAKFRQIKLSNKKIAETVTDVPGAVDVLRAMGWVDGAGDDGPTLVLPDDVRLAFETEVVKLIDVKDFYKKERAKAKLSQKREEAAAADPEKKALMEQLELDRREAAMRGPAVASHAKKLGDGPNIVRAGDIGIGQSAGG